MASPLGRIGKSLIKYFKPVRIAPPHYPGKRYDSLQTSDDRQQKKRSGQPAGQREDGSPKKEFQPFRPKLVTNNQGDAQISLQDQEKLKELDADAKALGESLPPLPKGAAWLDVVVYLLGACKRASEKVRKKVGIDVYRKSVLSRGKHKLQTLGSIIDTAPHSDPKSGSQAKKAA
ncbi:MAG: hypothetical protein AB1540_09510 [Bdellovibrionota bacterium]